MTKFDDAQQANPHYAQALNDATAIMANRREKYSGIAHPYFNFATVAKMQDVSLWDVFRFYINMKVARLKASTVDFDDERLYDTLIDLANYALLAAGSIAGQLTIEEILDESGD